MKQLPILILIFAYTFAYAQEKEFHIQGQIIDSDLKPVSDVYVLNYRNLEKAVSRSNGVFDMTVLPGDSLMVSHVSYTRKIVRVFELMVNPVIRIEMDTVNILEVNVSPNQKTDLERAQENLSFLSDLEVSSFEKIKTEESPTSRMLKEHNRIFRSEASSLSIYRFSPSGIIGDVKKKIKLRKQSNQYSSKKRYKKNYSGNSE